MPVDFTLIANPISSSGKALVLGDAVARELRALGASVEVRHTRGPGDATQLARAVEGGAVVACGGDGTFIEVLRGRTNPESPIGIVPAGLGNVVAKEFGLPRNAFALARILLARKVRRIDAGRVRAGTGEARLFSFLVSIGFDAEAIHRLHADRSGRLSGFHYLKEGWRAVQSADATAVDIDVDGKRWATGARYIAVANLASYGGPLRVMRAAIPDDGLLDVVALARPLAPRALKLMWTGWLRGYEAMPDARRCLARHVRIESATACAAQADGDLLPCPPLEIDVVPGGIPLIVP